MDPNPPGNRPSSAAVCDDLSGLAIESSPAGVLIVGPTGTIVLANAAIERQFGYSREELIGKPVGLLVPEPLRAVHAVHRTEPALDGPTVSLGAGREVFGRRKDGSLFPVDIGLGSFVSGRGVYVVASVVDVSEARRFEIEYRSALDDMLAFELLISELSSSFVNLPLEDVDSAIRRGQEKIVEALRLDRSALYQFEGDDAHMVLTHHWTPPTESPLPAQFAGEEQLPWTLSRLREGEPACFSSPDEIPDPVERESARQWGTVSRAVLPLWIGGRMIGSIGFSSTSAPRAWPKQTLDRLQLVAQVFSGVLARKRAGEALGASEGRFRTVADDAPVMIWMTGPDKACTWLNRQWLEFVGKPMAEQLGDTWASNLHPEDVEASLRTFRTSFDARQRFSMEYRLRRHDGVWRWVLDTGMPNYASDGTFNGYLGSGVDITEQKQGKLDLERALEEVRRLGDLLQKENVYLRREVKERSGEGPVVGQSAAVCRVLEQVSQVAPTDSTVLLFGETGTGKELFATQIHERSARCGRAMVRVNCSAIPATLIESELFGREKGAFTGALARQIGRFELADRSTIFLDEIGDLPIDVQVKLLRVLEQRQIERLGSPKTIGVDVRVIAATHRDLEQLMAAGSFREDLYYRLNVFPIRVPPLRERPEDIELLVWRFVDEFATAFGKRVESISRENMTALQGYSWPGNIRELRNVVERAMITVTGPRLTIPTPMASAGAVKRSFKLVDVERSHIRSVLETTNWRIRGPGGAADRLGLKPTTLETRLAKLGVKRPQQH